MIKTKANSILKIQLRHQKKDVIGADSQLLMVMAPTRVEQNFSESAFSNAWELIIHARRINNQIDRNQPVFIEIKNWPTEGSSSMQYRILAGPPIGETFEQKSKCFFSEGQLQAMSVSQFGHKLRNVEESNFQFQAQPSFPKTPHDVRRRLFKK